MPKGKRGKIKEEVQGSSDSALSPLGPVSGWAKINCSGLFQKAGDTGDYRSWGGVGGSNPSFMALGWYPEPLKLLTRVIQSLPMKSTLGFCFFFSRSGWQWDFDSLAGPLTDPGKVQSFLVESQPSILAILCIQAMWELLSPSRPRAVVSSPQVTPRRLIRHEFSDAVVAMLPHTTLMSLNE